MNIVKWKEEANPTQKKKNIYIYIYQQKKFKSLETHSKIIIKFEAIDHKNS